MSALPAIIVTDVYPPIPIRQFDYQAHYEGEEDEQMSVGHGATARDAVVDLIENHPRGIWCIDRDRRCDTCINMRVQWTRFHDGADDCRMVCSLRTVSGGWSNMPVDGDSTCSDHAFDGECFMPRTVFLPEPATEEILF